jgi:hypothetical protein
MKKELLILLMLLIFTSSCDEINKLTNPSDDYLIDKTISASTTEQVVESGTEFKMIFPANSLSGDITLKIKKEGSYPAFNVPNAKLGSNTYRIKFSGNTAFASPVKIIINYDKSQIPDGKTASEIIQAYIYSGGNWKIASYQLDEPNSKIIISISNLESPKIDKDKPELQGEGDMILSESAINEVKQDDSKVLETLLKTLTFGQMMSNVKSSYEYTEKEKGVITVTETKTNTHSPWMLSYMFNKSDDYKMNWNGNTFHISINRTYEKPDYEGWIFNDIYDVTGVVSNDGKFLNLTWYSTEKENRTINSSSYTQTTIREDKGSFAFVNLPLGSWVKDVSVTYELTGLAIKNLITNYSYSTYFYDNVIYSSYPESQANSTHEELSKYLPFEINENTRLFMTFYCR